MLVDSNVLKSTIFDNDNVLETKNIFGDEKDVFDFSKAK